MLDVAARLGGRRRTSTRRKLAADVNELVFEFEGMPLKDIRIGTLLRRVRRDHPRALDRDAVGPRRSCSRR